MTEFSAEERRELLERGRALPPEPGRFPIRPGSGDDVEHAASDVGRLPEHERGPVRRYITRIAVKDGTTDRLPDTWHIEGTEQ